MRLQLAVLPVPRHLQPVFSPAAFPKAAAKPSATDRPACCRDSRRSNYQLFRSWWKLPALKPARGKTPADVKEPIGCSKSAGRCPKKFEPVSASIDQDRRGEHNCVLTK